MGAKITKEKWVLQLFAKFFCKCFSSSLSQHNSKTSQRIHKINQTLFQPLLELRIDAVRKMLENKYCKVYMIYLTVNVLFLIR